jgi:arylsulfatase A-like enzyme
MKSLLQRPSKLLLACAAPLPIIAVLALIAGMSRWRPTLAERAAAQPFRVVLILLDATRADRLPFYGNSRNTAPFLNQLAAESAVFERAYAASSWTPSSVASLFTGLYPNQHQVLTGYNFTRRSQRSDRPLELNRIPDTAVTLPELMQRAGFATFGAANNPNIGHPMGFARGFQRFQQRRNPLADVINKQALRWSDALRKTPRSFLYLHYMDMHAPYQRHDPWFDASSKYTELAHYDSSIGYADAHIRELYEKLGWDRNTLLIILADHGEEFGDHGDHGHHNQLYSELLHVPLVFHWPGVIKPGRIETPVSLVDVRPTLEQLATGKPAETPSDGLSLLPLLDGSAIPNRTLFAIRWTETADPVVVRKAALSERWKYIYTEPGGREELYDMLEDPVDQHDRFADERDVAAGLRRELDRLDAQPVRHKRSFAESERSAGALEQQLRALGYVQ